ncbi:MAG TPA: 3-methyl-2-oxobutanoate dehydrogenase subunit VorB [Clostridiales bacterium]|nr:3-methyl-2-oxobutanoate dehydrogenase subunit VorB [Clostridiales bacterium]HQP70513.1 3-methyl-2-oxobutanoate dehydrogenase subunit VorB [Clostridiales bacterium]
MAEKYLMKGNEALAEAAIRAGIDGYFGYPITPQSEVLEYFSKWLPRKGIAYVQAESEVSAINMVYGAGGCGKRIMTTTSSPGYSLMQEGVSYIACAQIPCVLVNVQRGGPGLGTIQPSQGDYFQAVKGGGHGDYRLIVLTPNSVQETADMVYKAFDLSEKYMNPVLILSDGALGQMMEAVEFKEDYKKPAFDTTWASNGGVSKRGKPVQITSLFIEPERMEAKNFELQAKYKTIEENEVDYELYHMDDAELGFIAYGLSSRIAKKAVDLAREQGLKIGLIRPKTVWPFPSKIIKEYSKKVKAYLSIEMSVGQMIEDVKLAVECKIPVEHYGKTGGIVLSTDEIIAKAKKMLGKA